MYTSNYNTKAESDMRGKSSQFSQNPKEGKNTSSCDKEGLC